MTIGLSAVRASQYGLFIIWASACAFAPEAIWQGFLLFIEGFGSAEILTVVSISVLFTFFVEPITERLRTGRLIASTAGDHGGGTLAGGAVRSLIIGVVVVCVHESMASFFGGGHVGEQVKWIRLSLAISQALEWSSIPAAIAMAWLVAVTSLRGGIVATGLACFWTLVVGLIWGWSLQELVVTSIIGCLIATGGTWEVLRHAPEALTVRLARMIILASVSCIACALLIQVIIGWFLGSKVAFYTLADVTEDLRFYVGWSFGLLFSPDPTASRPISAATPNGADRVRRLTGLVGGRSRVEGG